MRHEIRIGIEGNTAIVLEQLQVADEVYDQKKHQEKPGQRHDYLLAQGRGKKLVKPAHCTGTVVN